MKIAIIGFQKSGKTTVFNALTGQHAETSAFATGKNSSNQAVVKVPDPRLDKLSALFKPKKHTPATVEYIDIAGIARQEGTTGEGLGDKQLNDISTVDAMIAVVRGFTDATGTPPDVTGDIDAMALEMAFSDLKKVDSRLERIGKQLGRSASGKEKEMLEAENEALIKLKAAFEEGKPARAVDLTEDQLKAIRGFQFLTLKPAMFVVNDGEEQWAAGKDQPVDLGMVASAPATMAARLCGQTEMEIAQMADEDRSVFLDEYGITEPAANRIIRLSYELLGQISFFTVGPDECRAWTITRNTLAPGAAGAIHSDLERGFIRAEVIRWEELLTLGSYAEAKKHGKLRLEGKAYVVQDGDIINVLFSA